ncbi:MAG: hypothetical protein ACE5JP_03400 [Candidatus Bipolaricaulia bacterium]
MTQVKAFLNGIYPRSEPLVSITRDYDRGRTGEQELKQGFQQDLEALIDLQVSSGLDYLSDGMLNWQDLYHPIVGMAEGLKAGPLERSFNTNTFYRQPIVAGNVRLQRSDDVDSEFFHRDGSQETLWKAVLPSPYLFSRVAANEFYHDENELMMAFTTELLKPLTQRLVERGISFIQLNEPYLVSHKPRLQDVKLFQEAIEAFTKDLNARVCIHTHFGDAEPIMEHLLDFEVDAIGIDFLETDLDSLTGYDFEMELVCGCVNSRSSLIEDEEVVYAFAHRTIEQLNPPICYLTTNTGLEFVPEEIARNKVRLLGRVAERLRTGG